MSKTYYTSNLMKHLKIQRSINLKQCSVFDCFSKAAATANVTPSCPSRHLPAPMLMGFAKLKM